MLEKGRKELRASALGGYRGIQAFGDVTTCVNPRPRVTCSVLPGEGTYASSSICLGPCGKIRRHPDRGTPVPGYGQRCDDDQRER